MVYQRKENAFRIEAGNSVFEGKRSDPYGFWTVSGKQGKTPISFTGEFTSCDDAVRAVKQKLNEMKITEEERI